MAGIKKNLFGSKPLKNPSESVDPLAIASEFILVSQFFYLLLKKNCKFYLEISSQGTTQVPPTTFYFEPAFMMGASPLYIVHPDCYSNITFPVSIKMAGLSLSQGFILETFRSFIYLCMYKQKY